MKRQEIQIYNGTPKSLPIKADVIGDFGVHKIFVSEKIQYGITHIPTGFLFYWTRTRKKSEAVDIAEALAALPGTRKGAFGDAATLGKRLLPFVAKGWITSTIELWALAQRHNDFLYEVERHERS